LALEVLGFTAGGADLQPGPAQDSRLGIERVGQILFQQLKIEHQGGERVADFMGQSARQLGNLNDAGIDLAPARGGVCVARRVEFGRTGSVACGPRMHRNRGRIIR
jgi:hypothetical protein